MSLGRLLLLIHFRKRLQYVFGQFDETKLRIEQDVVNLQLCKLFLSHPTDKLQLVGYVSAKYLIGVHIVRGSTTR